MRSLKSIRESGRRLLAKSLLPISTVGPRIKLRKNKPLQVLVDNSVLGHAITHESGWVSTGTALWGDRIEVPTGYLARIPVHSSSNEGRLYHEIRYLAGIAHLGQSGHLKLCTSAELDAERFRQPAGRYAGYGWADFNVFDDVQLHSVDGLQLDLENPKEAQLARVGSCKDPLYQSILQKCGDKQSLDAYHIFTAERFGLFCFLHIDFPLADTVKQRKHSEPFRSLKTRILLPSELAGLIGLLPIDTNALPLAEDDTFFPTRADLHSDQQKRQRPKPPK